MAILVLNPALRNPAVWLMLSTVRTQDMKSTSCMIVMGLLIGIGTGCDVGISKTTTIGGAKPYPLQVCPVSGEKLGEMGDPVVFVHQGQEIKLCCKNCRKDFDADPAKYLTKLTAK